MKTKISFFIGIITMLAIGLTSCDKKRVFDGYVTVPEKGWSKDSLALFNVAISNTSASYNFIVNVRNTPDYPNSNLWLFIEVTSPSGKTERDKLECTLANQEGKWLGSGWGSIYQCRIPFKTMVKLPEAGTYKVKLAHGMRTNELVGIRDLGLRVEINN
jgi:gliding motility-associated lipoprotein GldH